MNLFQELNRVMTEDSVMTITVRKKNDTKLIVLTDLSTIGLTDPAAAHIPPLKVSGTAVELDKEWLQTILSPVESSVGLQTNMKEFEEGLKKAEEKRKAEDSKKKAEADEKDNALDKLINEGREAFKKKDWKTAVSKWEEASTNAKELKKEFKTNCLKKDLETARKNAAAAPTLLDFDSFSDSKEENSQVNTDTDGPQDKPQEAVSDKQPQEEPEQQKEEPQAEKTGEENKEEKNDDEESHSFDEFDDM